MSDESRNVRDDTLPLLGHVAMALKWPNTVYSDIRKILSYLALAPSYSINDKLLNMIPTEAITTEKHTKSDYGLNVINGLPNAHTNFWGSRDLYRGVSLAMNKASKWIKGDVRKTAKGFPNCDDKNYINTMHQYFTATQGCVIKHISPINKHILAAIKSDYELATDEEALLEKCSEELPYLFLAFAWYVACFTYEDYRYRRDKDPNTILKVSEISVIRTALSGDENLKEENMKAFRHEVPEKSRGKAKEKQKKVKARPVSVWQCDAEFLTREQYDFGNFTRTQRIDEILRTGSLYWGIVSVKGVGKTYILQRLRREIDYNELALALPKENKKSNNWGLTNVKIVERPAISRDNFSHLVELWKVAILCYVLGNTVKLKSSLRESYMKILEYDKQRLNRAVYGLLIDNVRNLTTIFGTILREPMWHQISVDAYPTVSKLCQHVMDNLGIDDKYPIAVFIDRVDQSVSQPSAEVPYCHSCPKEMRRINCTDKRKDTDFCIDEKCVHRDCCYFCHIFVPESEKKGHRVYGSKRGKRYEHIGFWHYIQLSLIAAVFDVKFDFGEGIKIFYSVRKEALFAEYDLLSAHNSKYKKLYMEMYYYKDEQERIFINCIKMRIVHIFITIG